MALRRAIVRIGNFQRSTCRSLCTSQTLCTQTAPKEDHHEKKQTHFGFETIDEEEKTKKVHQVFETVADKYDLMNDVMSLGIHRVWKDIFMQRLAPTPGTKLLDMAGGTGDISFRYINYLRNLGPHAADKQSSVTVSDINQAMLDVGRVRAERQGYANDPLVSVDWLCADAEQLPLPDECYTAYTIAFGIRNCTHVDKVLEEAYRVLQPGGRFLCLEFSQLPNAQLQWMYDQYSFQVIPVLGQLVAGQWKPYQYLVESIRQFPDQESFKSMIEDAGFRHVTYENLTFGVCSIHSGFKI
ncbi:2-methoxy-6-polyprenyl-1,4-benzoquinol methylase, mitochondrial [Colias croceus]|uniref:2-methoxy-6-polyprenyl-1,4-benzoquinol methylase, mitochondrial n=1 Tax=Colias crocea TaxID=72248 RepID=UPI001E27D110|nr:2-methoxy-6-polyprenyl-1,4-benzoquinol methylase, mitochondrial [Colias croceus]